MKLSFILVPFLTVLLFLQSCSHNVLIDTTHEFETAEWAYPIIPAFPFQIDDLTYCYNLDVNLQVSEEYPYKNIYLLMHLKHPDGKEIQNRINLELMDGNGKWLGSGSADLKSFSLPVATDLCLEQAGQYVVGIEQNMRDSILHHVKYVGLRVSKGNPVF